jgi:hypothetical protein
MPEHAASTWITRAKPWSIPALSALMLVLAARGGDWLGDWYVRQSPSAPIPTATPGMAPVSMPPAHLATPQQDEPPLDDDTRAQIEERYAYWKRAHGLSTDDMMALYAPNAYISFVSGQNTEGLRAAADGVRQSRTYSRVEDTTLPKMTGTSQRATVAAQNRYLHSDSKTPFVSARTLVWENRGGQWLIVRDELGSFGSTSSTWKTPLHPSQSSFPSQRVITSKK